VPAFSSGSPDVNFETQVRRCHPSTAASDRPPSNDPAIPRKGPVGPEALWTRFFATRAVPERNALVLHYAPLVKYVTTRMAAAYPSHVELEDLMAAGIDGLFDAIARADQGQTQTFERYACILIRYAVLEELRSLDHVSRPDRRNIRKLEETSEALAHLLGRLPTPADVAGKLGWTLKKVNLVMARSDAVRLCSYDAVTTPPECLFDGGPTPEEAHGAFMGTRGLWEAVDRLPAQHRQVVEMFYRSHMHQNEIAPRLGITPGRVSQIHSQAIAELRHALSGLDGAEMTCFPSPDHLLQ